MKSLKECVPNLVVSVTTIPRRFHQSLPAVIESIQRQSLRCKIIINIAAQYVKWPNEKIVVPDHWAQDPDIHVHTTSRDFGPATKLLGAIEFLARNRVVKGIDPEKVTHVVTIDDDIVYSDPQFLQRFLDASVRYPKYAIPVKSITLSHPPYHCRDGLTYDREGFVDAPRGYCGVLYPVREFAPDRFYMSPEFLQTLPAEVFNDDDAFFGMILGAMNIPVFVVDNQLDAREVDAGASAVQEGVDKDRTTAEMELYQFAVRRGFLPNRHRTAGDSRSSNDASSTVPRSPRRPVDSMSNPRAPDPGDAASANPGDAASANPGAVASANPGDAVSADPRDEFWRWFDSFAAPRLGRREISFRKVLRYLDEITAGRRVTIVETGCVRIPDNWEHDGQSTVLFDRYLGASAAGSRGYSVDIDARATASCRTMVGDRFDIRTGDSVLVLRTIAEELQRDGRRIDLLYLDSHDVEWGNVVPSAVHHLKELVSIIDCVGPATLVVVDDAPRECMLYPNDANWFQFLTHPQVSGKGKFVAEYARQVGATERFAHYQAGWTGLR